ncbi:MAG: hypothetical protein E6370_01365 [Clostridiales bacterium]|uniref:hypothetical protein n=1 Tax=Zhenhengia sp. TaxID=2944208 RepID=UPI0029070D57|nr:hypothetical protein [Clostridiales bacterium]MDU6972958.1 hypothetical protein [Clostridiales bacterium]
MTPTSGIVKIAGRAYREDKNNAKQLIGCLSGNSKRYGKLSPREILKIFGKLYERKL